jgi:hypothetical protein
VIEQTGTERPRADDVLAAIEVPRQLDRRQWVGAASGDELPVIDPATGREVARVARAGAGDVDRAVAAAVAAFEEGAWSRMPVAERARALQRFADAIETRIDDLYQVETVNNGRPITETRAQLARLPEWYRYNAALLLADRTDVIQMPGPYHTYTTRFPIGVAGILSPFNHPMMIGSKSLAPALATGNSVVLKPSELTPLTSLLLGQIAVESEIPPGVLNVIPGIGAVAGRRLSEHPDVGKITFTGGTAAGGPSPRPPPDASRRSPSSSGQDAGDGVRGRDVDVAASGVAFGGCRRGPDVHLRESGAGASRCPRRLRRTTRRDRGAIGSARP